MDQGRRSQLLRNVDDAATTLFETQRRYDALVGQLPSAPLEGDDHDDATGLMSAAAGMVGGAAGAGGLEDSMFMMRDPMGESYLMVKDPAARPVVSQHQSYHAHQSAAGSARRFDPGPRAGHPSSPSSHGPAPSALLSSSSILPGDGGGRGPGGNGGVDRHGAASTLSQHRHSANVARLMETVDTLRQEKASLAREVAELSKHQEESMAARREVTAFRQEFGAKFATLKGAMEAFRANYVDGNARLVDELTAAARAGGGSGGSGGSGDSDGDWSAQGGGFKGGSGDGAASRMVLLGRVRELEDQVHQLTEKNVEQAELIGKYQAWYRDLRAKAKKKASVRKQSGAGSPAPPMSSSPPSSSSASRRNPRVDQIIRGGN